MSRRWRYPRTRRGKFFPVVRAVSAPAPPYPPALQEPAGRSARLAASRSRRGRFLAVPQPQSAPPVRARPVRRLSATRRGRFFTVPFTVATTASPWTPTSIDVRRTPARSTRRGQYFPVPPASSPIPPGIVSRRTPVRPARRGHYFAVPLAGLAPPAAPWVPPATDIRRAPPRTTRRGRYFTVPLVGVAPPPPVTIPQVTRERTRLWAVRRGRYWNAPQIPLVPPVAQWVPVFARTRRPLAGPMRRGDYQGVPPTVACPYPVTSRRARLPASRRSRLWGPPCTTQLVGPGPLVARTRTRRAPHLPTRRGVFIEPFWLGLAPTATVYGHLVATVTDPLTASASGSLLIATDEPSSRLEARDDV